MRAWSALLVTAALLAGCLDDAPNEERPDPEPEPRLPQAGPGTFYHLAGGVPADPAALAGDNTAFLARGGYHGIGFSTFEPTIGSTSSGALFMTNFRGTGAGTHIIRGTGNGTVWEDVGPTLGPLPVKPVPNSNDPFLYVDPWTDRIYDFDMCLILSGFCVAWSDDDGGTWLTQSVATGEAPALDHQSLASAPPPEDVTTVGYPNVLVFCVNRGTTATGSWCSSSLDGGIAWTPLVPGFPAEDPQCSGLSGHVVGSPDGRFYRGNPSCGGAAVYRSDDGGLTWSEHTIPGTDPMGHEIAAAVDETGNVYAFWIGSDGLPYLAASRDHAETWTQPMMVGAPGITATGFPTAVGGASGRVAFAYIGTGVEGGYGGNQQNAEWSGYVGAATDAFANGTLITTVAVNAAADPLATGRCGDVRCGGFGDFIDITIDFEGRPWAALSHNGHGDTGIVGTFTEGPALRGELRPLPKIVLGGPDSLG